MNTPGRLVGVKAIAAFLACDVKTARKRIEAGIVPAARIGGSWIAYADQIVEAERIRSTVGAVKAI